MQKKLFLTGYLLLIASALYAHSIWIETASHGSSGKEHIVNVFFGVFDKNEREIIGGPETRWPEVEKFTAWVVSPKGEKIPLTFQAASDHYAARFTPREKGVYTVLLENKVREVADWRETKAKIGIVKQNFYSRTTIQVGKGGASSAHAVSDLLIDGHTEGQHDAKTVMLHVTYKGKPVKSTKLTIRYPGKTDIEIMTDESGRASFVPEQPGMHFVLALLRFDTPGEYNGVAYEAIREKGTLTLDVPG